MRRHLHLIIWITAALCLLLQGCVTEEDYDDTPNGNFEALWDILDRHYCFFPDKAGEYGLDWNEVHNRYRPMLTPDMTDEQLFEVCARMLRELRDGHVNLSAPFNTARFWDWYENYPANFSDSLQRIYLGKDYGYSSGLKYTIFKDNIGYLYCGSFEGGFGSGNLSAIFSRLAVCNGLIVDVRNNEGGLLTSAQALAECFTNEEIVGGYMAHKTGKAHDALSKPKAIRLKPADGMRWQKRVVVLTNRRCFSAANAFVMFMKACPNVIIAGAQTGGGGGMPFNSELPNGWSVRFSACPIYDKDMNCIESGITPDVAVDLTSYDMSRNTDTMIETARALLSNP